MSLSAIVIDAKSAPRNRGDRGGVTSLSSLQCSHLATRGDRRATLAPGTVAEALGFDCSTRVSMNS